uniref:Uncharacterized protein n=1 Tax=Arundo donax TaxID=35708 RepID=A0A0A8ZHT8_ARUDO
MAAWRTTAWRGADRAAMAGRRGCGRG